MRSANNKTKTNNLENLRRVKIVRNPPINKMENNMPVLENAVVKYLGRILVSR
jgi:hypothetical protein